MFTVRPATESDWPGIWAIMEPVVRAGATYCWDTSMTEGPARREWLDSPDPTVRVYVAADNDGALLGTAQLHANRPGSGAHMANASFMVAAVASGRGVARTLGEYVLSRARAQGYRAMQFNAVVETNVRAVKLWESLGFRILTTVPGAFNHPDQGYVGLHLMFREL
ncbi:GNAT family N-acetyltransferase [Arthrobacter sp. H5]|uniref:GNAT family N-acetyltransferase n=1 Tax=Arthrobacter sp. H5 TaxID=1267973 RepID=UPI000482B3F2|nr:GNAT family N-acetyltransferase [Arthrobacter sp. H5]